MTKAFGLNFNFPSSLWAKLAQIEKKNKATLTCRIQGTFRLGFNSKKVDRFGQISSSRLKIIHKNLVVSFITIVSIMAIELNNDSLDHLKSNPRAIALSQF